MRLIVQSRAGITRVDHPNVALAQGFDSYRKQVRRRGGEAMAAMREAFGGIHVMLTFGPSESFLNAREASLEVTLDGLLPAFVDGMLQEAQECTITDAYEGSYGDRRAEQFRDAAWTIRYEAANLSTMPQAFLDRMQVGFGIWPAGGEAASSSTAVALTDARDVITNHHTPDELTHALNFALEHSDGTVWLYGEGTNWFEVSQAYLDAIRNAKDLHDYRFQPEARPDKGEGGWKRVKLFAPDSRRGPAREALP